MRVFGSLRLGRPDSNGVLWTYSTPVNAELGAAPEQAPAIQVPEIKSLTLRLVTNASRRQVGAGLRVMSGKAAVEEILRDGKPAQAQVKLLDSRGRVVASAAGPLSNFGFG